MFGQNVQLKFKGKVLNVSLSDDEFDSSTNHKNSSSDEQVNFMAFMSNIDCSNLQEICDQSKTSDNDANVEESLQDAYNQLFKESLKLQKANKHYKKIDFQ